MENSEFTVRIDQLSRGTCGIVARVDAVEEEQSRLMAMGVCAGRHIQMIKHGDPMILNVLDTRVGVSARLARNVYATPCVGPCGRRS